MEADLNKLKHILGKSKALMRQTDETLGAPKPMGGLNKPQQQVTEYAEKEPPNLTEEFAKKYGMTDGKIPSKSVSPKNGNYPNMEKSKMPKAVLDAMRDNPIEIPENPFAANSFSLDDVPELMETPKPQRVVENHTPKTSPSISREDIKEVIREEFEDLVRDVLDEYMEKSLVTEDIHIKIGETVFGGNLKPLPKKKKGRRVIKR